MAMTFDERQRRARARDEAEKQYPDLFKVPDVPLSQEEFARMYVATTPRIHTSNVPDSESGVIFPTASATWDQELLAQFNTVGAFRSRGREWPRPTDEVIKDLQSNRPKQIIIDDIYPQGEPMKLFTFATTKPPAATIWKTLMETDIQPSDGLSVMQIRYLIFHYFQESSVFEVVKVIINAKLSATQQPGIWADCGIVLSDLRKVTPAIPAFFPNWAGVDLYIPYYMAKQLEHPIAFDRETISDLEDDHLRIDSDEGESRYTAYSLWKRAPDMMQFFSIDMSLSPITVADRDHLVAILRAEIDSTLASNHDHIINTSDKITIPPFVLGAPDEA